MALRRLRARARAVLISMAALGLADAAVAQRVEAPLIPRSVIWASSTMGRPRLSPDGNRLAYLAQANGTMNVWVRDVAGGDGRTVTHATGRDLSRFWWQSDGQHILYISDNAGEEQDHIYQVDIRSGQTRDLTPYPGVSAYILSFSARRPNEILIGMNRRDRAHFDIYRLDLISGAPTLDTQDPGDASDWAADNDLQVRAILATRPDFTKELRVRNDAGSPWRTIQTWGWEDDGSLIGFSPNGRLWLLSSHGADTQRLLEIDTVTGAQNVLAQDPHYDVASVMSSPETGALEAVQIVRDRRDWLILDSRLRRDFARLTSAHEGDVSVVSRDADNSSWIVSYQSPSAPTTNYLFNRANGRSHLLFTENAAIARYQLSHVRPISFRARDGLTIHGYLTLPPNAEGGRNPRLPLIVKVHGGPWVRDVWGDPGPSREVQWLANRGYAVLQVNYRGSAGYGKAFLNAGNREWGGRINDDLVDARRWAVARGFADPDRACILGYSFGGYAALVAVSFTPREFRCAVVGFGESNLVSLIRSIPPQWNRAVFDVRVGDVDTEQEFLRSRSPLFRVDQITAPLLIIHGVNDPRVPVAESDQIVAALRARGNEVEYIRLEGEGHGDFNPVNGNNNNIAIERFLARHLGGRAEPPGG